MNEPTPEQVLRIYSSHVQNLRTPDSSGMDEIIVLVTRTGVDRLNWTPDQRAQIDRLDEKLASNWRLFKGTLPHPAEHPREQWWWYLHEGPQVLEEARRVKA